MVLAIFGSEASADRAVAALKGSALVPGDAIGVLVLGGELEVGKAGSRRIGTGAGIGAVLFLPGPAVAGIGVLGESLPGTVHHKGPGLGENDRDRIVTELRGGRAAVGVLAPAGVAGVVSARLADLGGVPETHAVSNEALQQARPAALCS
jgi:hypothetical protein